MHFYRCHPSLQATRRGPVVGSNSVHLHQSDLDGACGAHCVSQALLVLGVLKRQELNDISDARGAAKSMWRVAKRKYFVGAGMGELQSMLLPFDEEIEARAYRKHGIVRTLDVLAESGVAILAISSQRFNHWVLAIGVSGFKPDSDSLPSKLLILDPGHNPVPLAPWNATLKVQGGSLNRRAYETPTGKVFVDVGSVLTIKRSAEEICKGRHRR